MQELITEMESILNSAQDKMYRNRDMLMCEAYIESEACSDVASHLLKLAKQFLQKEKEAIIEAYKQGDSNAIYPREDSDFAEQYFKTKYGQ